MDRLSDNKEGQVKYDYLIVGAGLYGSVFAHEAHKKGKKVLVIDKRNHIAGNIYTEKMEDINVHKYGAHIFHTNNSKVWNYVTEFATFNRFTNSPVANYKGEIYSLPFNMYTFNKMWGVVTPEEARAKIEKQKSDANIKEPSNLEEQAISLVGIDIYNKLIKGYTEKQWGRPCNQLPSFIIKRLPVRFTYDNNYFNDRFQGIPIGGYTLLVERMLGCVEVRLNTDFFDKKEEYMNMAKKVIYTGRLDEFYNYSLGRLEYRSLKFETKILDVDNFQGNAVVNYTGREVPYTRVIEHKHFEFNNSAKTVVTYEYPSDMLEGMEPFYTVNDEKNNNLALEYRNLASIEDKVIFGGRLGDYRYYDMDDVIKNALDLELE